MKSLRIYGKRLFINGQDPEIAAMFDKLSVLEPYLKSGLNQDLDGVLMIDEYQFIPNIDTTLKLIVDKHEKLKILCSGSSSLDVLQKVDESLAGRVRIIPVFSLSFEEYLRFVDEPMHEIYQSYSVDFPAASIEPPIARYFEDFIIYGGLPRVALQSNYDEKRELLDDIYKTYLLRDIRAYVRNEDSVAFNRMLKLIAHQVGNLVNPHELSRTSGLTYRKAEEYLWLLEQMHILIMVEPYLSNARKSVVKMRKVFFTDNGLRNLIAGNLSAIDLRPDNGSLFESTMFLELRKLLPGSIPIRFFRSLEGSEIDFIAGSGDSSIALEIKYSDLSQPSGTAKLARFAAAEGIKNPFLVNKNFTATHQDIQFLPGIMLGKMKFPV
jgi:predicted AAA+ superfamily ATPase